MPVAAAVEGTLVHGVGGNLRGLSQERGPRSVRSTCVTGLIPHVRRTDDKRVSSGRTRRGTTSAYAKRTHSTPTGAPATRPPQLEDTSFARSRDPCASIATELDSVKSRAGWRDRFGIAVGQTWVNQEEPAPGLDRTDECAACHVSPPQQWGGRDARRKGSGSWPRVPARRSESSGLVARTSECSCRSRQAVSGPKYARTQRSQKSGGASERGPSSAR